MTKYELTSDAISLEGKTLYRIAAIRDFGDVRAGDLGGFVESEDNLDQDGDCWVYDEAKVLEQATVKKSAKIRGHAIVRGHAKVWDEAVVQDHAIVMDHAFLFHNAVAMNYARVYGNAEVYSHAVLSEYAQASHHACVTANVSGKAHVTDMTTKTPLSIDGLEYQVTFMDHMIQFDCMTKTKEEWIHCSREELVRIGGLKAVRFHNKYLSLLTHIADHHFKDSSKNF
jgi:carbonic anhydrase/acetyltransferase-like protein (isoleucine patch superfamily)